MIRRFQIDDLIFQDASGVTFRALDTETGGFVALRRFFPFGADGGGLHADEQTAYNIALGRLAGLRHPSMRAVVSGGCDPVDGIPYIATEWIDGQPLHELIAQQGPLPLDKAVRVITQALEVCELLSHVLAEESVWVETEIPTIVVGGEDSGREFTFWISPLKWLGGNGEYRGLQSIVSLTETLMGWQGRIINDQAGRGLGAWLNWLRAAAQTTSLKEAREMLAASIGAEPPPPAKQLVTAATRPPAVPSRPLRASSSKAPVIAVVALVLATAGIGIWFWLTRGASQAPAGRDAVPSPPAATREAKPKPAGKGGPTSSTPARESAAEDPLDRINRRAAELSQQAENTDQAASATLADQQTAVDANGGVFSPAHRELLFQRVDQEVTVEGVLHSFAYSQTRKTLYLVFEGDGGWDFARGRILIAQAPADLTEDALKPLVGKKLRITGIVEAQKVSGKSRPLINLTTRASIAQAP